MFFKKHIFKYIKFYGLNCAPPNSYIEALTPNVTIFGDMIHEVIKVKGPITVGP